MNQAKMILVQLMTDKVKIKSRGIFKPSELYSEKLLCFFSKTSLYATIRSIIGLDKINYSVQCPKSIYVRNTLNICHQMIILTIFKKCSNSITILSCNPIPGYISRESQFEKMVGPRHLQQHLFTIQWLEFMEAT